MGNFAGKEGDSGELMRGDGGGTPHSGGVGLQAPIPPPQEFHHRRYVGCGMVWCGVILLRGVACISAVFVGFVGQR